jgi:hypothetical protein
MSENKFKVGDRVRVIAVESAMHKMTGYVKRYDKNLSLPYHVESKCMNWDNRFRADELEPAPAVKECLTVDNAQTTGKQAFIQARYDCIDPLALRLVAECVGFGAIKYGEHNHRRISVRDHLNHAMNHVNEHRTGDESEMHLVHAIARLLFAVELIVQSGAMEDRYFHPDMVEGVSEEVSGE